MSNWEIGITRAREEFIEGLADFGFVLSDDGQTLRGVLDLPENASESPVSLEIRLPESFPFKAPKVRPSDGVLLRSWHCEPEGWLCLYSDSDTKDLPWQDPSEFLSRIRHWFVCDEEGWGDDEPTLDLERYFERVADTIVFDDLSRYVGRSVMLKRDAQGFLHMAQALPPIQKGKQHKRRYEVGWVDDLGELEEPVRGWEDVAALLGDRAATIETMIQRRGCDFLLLRYSRKGNAGAVVLFITGSSPISLRAGHALDTSREAIRLRSGYDATSFAEASVAIVGIGAIGSFLADLLARSGIGRLTLQDGQILKPGNCVRHFAGLLTMGQNKAMAVRTYINANGYMDKDSIEAVPYALSSPAEALELLSANDLVVEATGSGPLCAMLEYLSQDTGRSFLSVCLQRDGEVIRCDRWPLREGEGHKAQIPPSGRPLAPLHDSGCGDPISPTPPFAVVAAANLAFRVIRDLLTGRMQHGPTVIEVLQAQDDEPYDSVGLL